MDRLGSLLSAVYAAPDDVQARLVYADALSDVGDPRGELIALQCRRTTAKPSARERALLAKHGAAWSGQLAKILDLSRSRFERGFLSAAWIKKGPRPAILKTAGDPVWSTVEELSFDEEVGGVVVKSGPVVRGARVPAAALLLHANMRSLRTVRGIDGDVLMTLCRDGKALPLRSIVASTYDLLEQTDEDWRFVAKARDLLVRARGLPNLTRLELHGFPCDAPDLRWLLRSPVAGRLESLTLSNFGGPVDLWIAHARAAHEALPELVVDYWGVLRFRRGRDGVLSELRIDRKKLTAHQRAMIDQALARVAPGTVQLVA